MASVLTKQRNAKPTTWEHVAKLRHGGANNVEARDYTASGYRSRMGRSSVTIRCPFCGDDMEAFVWSMRGGGKRCPNLQCRAILGSGGSAYRLVQDNSP